jgi:rSAM/selenodomain-associated transferase 1
MIGIMSGRRLVLFTKPAIPGRVKTRLVGHGPGELSAEGAAELHRAFLDDVAERLLAAEARGELELLTAWALDGPDGQRGDAPLPDGPGRSFRQQGATLGDRLVHGLSVAAEGDAAVAATDPTGAAVAALGSDHPTVSTETIRDAFERVEAGAEVVLGPSDDGGYFLIALAPGALRRELFDGVAWSTSAVLEQTLERAAGLGLSVELLPTGHDVDTAEDLDRLARELSDPEVAALCPRTRALLAAWGRVAEPVEVAP